ncbi:hypothetical protein J7T55_014305 [Diaporthe amygdali]|uniref:uncharacterized protein n=1 Tax=Phomopsis amygdali TaxID=1214568 RepID=UPI0022FE4550|nr:uncharacterized protein J7T55_014305 [Diaporthe amygdali]KAJ0117855.1 hypothetical protein J7T55_014305 [Diaporthe amygdali]
MQDWGTAALLRTTRPKTYKRQLGHLEDRRSMSRKAIGSATPRSRKRWGQQLETQCDSRGGHIPPTSLAGEMMMHRYPTGASWGTGPSPRRKLTNLRALTCLESEAAEGSIPGRQVSSAQDETCLTGRQTAASQTGKRADGQTQSESSICQRIGSGASDFKPGDLSSAKHQITPGQSRTGRTHMLAWSTTSPYYSVVLYAALHTRRLGHLPDKPSLVQVVRLSYALRTGASAAVFSVCNPPTRAQVQAHQIPSSLEGYHTLAVSAPDRADWEWVGVGGIQMSMTKLPWTLMNQGWGFPSPSIPGPSFPVSSRLARKRGNYYASSISDDKSQLWGGLDPVGPAAAAVGCCKIAQ